MKRDEFVKWLEEIGADFMIDGTMLTDNIYVHKKGMDPARDIYAPYIRVGHYEDSLITGHLYTRENGWCELKPIDEVKEVIVRDYL